jgi:hypothetical protein
MLIPDPWAMPTAIEFHAFSVMKNEHSRLPQAVLTEPADLPVIRQDLQDSHD